MLVLLTGLILTQLISAFILLRDRGQILYQSMRDDLINRTTGIVRLLESFPVKERLLFIAATVQQGDADYTVGPADLDGKFESELNACC